MRLILIALFLCAVAGPALACGDRHPPPLASKLAQTLPKAKLSTPDRARARKLLVEIKRLGAAGHTDEAREREEEAMGLLGYERFSGHCGGGWFAWVKRAVEN
jgi:hypothetical protein